MIVFHGKIFKSGYKQIMKNGDPGKEKTQQLHAENAKKQKMPALARSRIKTN